MFALLPKLNLPPEGWPGGPALERPAGIRACAAIVAPATLVLRTLPVGLTGKAAR